jgi:hypothetical protein
LKLQSVSWRELAAASPARYRPDLAQSLVSLGIRFSELGRRAEATAAHDEAMKTRAQPADDIMKPCRIRAQNPCRH